MCITNNVTHEYLGDLIPFILNLQRSLSGFLSMISAAIIILFFISFGICYTTRLLLFWITIIVALSLSLALSICKETKLK